MAENTPVTVHRTERVLAYMVASSIGLSILAILALLFAGLAGVDTSQGVWLTVRLLPPIGLTIGVLFVIILVAVSAVRRSRAARDAA